MVNSAAGTQFSQDEEQAMRELARFLKPKMQGSLPRMTVQQQYRYEPAKFVRDVIHVKPEAYQERCLNNLVEYGRECIRSLRGPGKTTLEAWTVLWFAETRDGLDWKCPTTAGSWRQLTHFLWPEIRKWARQLDWKKLGRKPYNPRTELLGLSLHLSTGEAFAAASNNPDLMEGAHATHMLYVVDEAKSIEDATFDAIEGSFIGAEEALYLIASTPGQPIGRFYAIQSHAPGYEDWHVDRITVDEAIESGRVSPQLVENRRRQWGEASALFQTQMLGNFASTDEDGVVPLAWIENSNARWLDAIDPATFTAREAAITSGEGPHAAGSESALNPQAVDPGSEPILDFNIRTAYPAADKQAIERFQEYLAQIELTRSSIPDRLTCISVDVARSGEAKTVIAHRYGRAIKRLEYYAKQDTMVTAGMVAAILDAPENRSTNPKPFAVIDVNGLGVGVYDRLREQGYNVVAFSGSEHTRRRDRTGQMGFFNVRCAAWWRVRELLDPVNTPDDQLLLIPEDATLARDLTAPTWKVMSDAKIQVEPKEHLVARIGVSTDAGDAVCMAMWMNTAGAQLAQILVKPEGSRWRKPEYGDVEAYSSGLSPSDMGFERDPTSKTSRWRGRWH